MSKKFDALESQKALLRMKALLERMELGAHIQEVKQEFAWVSVFQRLVAWAGRRNMVALGPLATLGSGAFDQFLKKHPILGLLGSAMLLRYRQPLLRAGVKAGLAASVLAVGVYWFRSRDAHRTGQPQQPAKPTPSTTVPIDPKAP